MRIADGLSPIVSAICYLLSFHFNVFQNLRFKISNGLLMTKWINQYVNTVKSDLEVVCVKHISGLEKRQKK